MAAEDKVPKRMAAEEKLLRSARLCSPSFAGGIEGHHAAPHSDDVARKLFSPDPGPTVQIEP
eukprot:9375060-Karenia_brevis.AAC.1